MKKYIFACFFLFLTNIAFASQGHVVLQKSNCDYYIVSTGDDFALLEWYGGDMPELTDFIVGDFESYGFKDLYNVTSDEEIRAYVEDYWLSANSVIEKYKKKCG